MAKITGKVLHTTFKSDRNNVSIRLIMFAAGILIEVNAMNDRLHHERLNTTEKQVDPEDNLSVRSSSFEIT